MAARTSASQTKSTSCGGGGAGGGSAAADVPAPGLVSQVKPVLAPVARRERKRSTTSAATLGAVAGDTAAGWEMPRAARYRSTAATTVPRSTGPETAAPRAVGSWKASSGLRNE